MAEPSTEPRPTSPTLRQIVVAVSVVMGTVVGAFVGYIACWVVALCDMFPIGDPKDGPARVPVGEPVYIGIMVGGVILGLVASCSLMTRRTPSRPPLTSRDHGVPDDCGPAHIAAPVLPAPWLRVDADTAKKLANNLARELGPGHVLAGVAAVGFARRDDRDDVIYRLHGHASQFAIVHLTWHRASRPEWPSTTLFANGDDLVAHCQSERE